MREEDNGGEQGGDKEGMREEDHGGEYREQEGTQETEDEIRRAVNEVVLRLVERVEEEHGERERA